MKKWLFLLFCLFVVGGNLHVSAETPEIEQIKDSLLRKMSRLKENDPGRLEILYQIVKVVYNPQTAKYYTDKLLEEADKQKNDFYRCEAYLSYMYAGYNAYNSEEVNRWMEKLEPIARKEKLYDLLFMGKACVVDMLMMSGQYELEEKEAKKMFQEAKQLDNPTGIASAAQCLANLYTQTGRYREAARVLEENYLMALKGRKNLSFSFGNVLARIYSMVGDNENLLKWLKIQEKHIDQYVKKEPGETQYVKLWRVMNSIYYISYYTQKEDIVNAEKYLKQAEVYYEKGYESTDANYHSVRMKYFGLTKNWNKQLEEILHLQNIYQSTTSMSHNITLFNKATVLDSLGWYDASLEAFDSAFAARDSLLVSHLNVQLAQVRKDYNADSLLLERERIDRITQLSLFGVIVLLFVFLIFYAFHSFRVRRILRRSEEEMRVMSEDMEKANVVKELFLSTISSSISVPLNQVVEGAMLLASGKKIGTKRRAEVSDNLNRTSAQLLQLINNILDLSRLEAGMMKLAKSDLEIVSFVRMMVRKLVMEDKIPITSSFPEGKSLTLNVDVTRLSELFTRLFSVAYIDDELIVKMELSDNDTRVLIYVYGSRMLEQETSQDIVIANEINRMLLEQFGGKYEVHREATPPFILLNISAQ